MRIKSLRIAICLRGRGITLAKETACTRAVFEIVRILEIVDIVGVFEIVYHDKDRR